MEHVGNMANPWACEGLTQRKDSGVFFLALNRFILTFFVHVDPSWMQNVMIDRLPCCLPKKLVIILQHEKSC